MKMNRQNPGGEGALKGGLKGSEKYQARGKGDLQTGYAPGGMKKFDQAARGNLSGPANRGTAHAKTSFSGATPSGSSKACR